MKPGPLAVRELVNKALSTAQSRNPRLSLRAFSKRIGIPVSTVSHLLTGRRSASLKLAKKILDSLKAETTEHERILSLFQAHRRLHADPNSLSREARALAEFARCRDFSSDEKYLTRKLSSTSQRIRAALEELVQAGVLERDATGTFRRSDEPRIPEEFDLACLESATLQFASQNSRSQFSSQTVALRAEDVAEIQALIERLRGEVSRLSNQDAPDEVFNLSVLFYPVTAPLNLDA